MGISINGKHSQFFPDEYSSKQRFNENTLIDTICHEILHGMGMVTTFTIEKGFLSNFNYTTYNDNLVNFTVLLNSFEKHIYTSNAISIGKWVDEMNKENTKFNIPSPIRALYTEEHSKSAQSIVNYAQKPNGLYFQTWNKKKVYLETGLPFLSDVSIAHISSKYNTTTDRLITRRSMNGQGIHDISKKGWKTSPFGKRTLQILKTMGYKLNPSPKYEKSLAYFNDKKKNSTNYDDPPADKNTNNYNNPTPSTENKEPIREDIYPKYKETPAKRNPYTSYTSTPAQPGSYGNLRAASYY
ncbi:hypothetical protein DSO57_1036918 [Entomophthora muscae]|uniref:Uncharacterized protein n=1 Tax=Entomophthora muscae TaxID=34485 RepID=A0ACC2S123_9FUNG|nr:hypothetical protein DSO57_1036918 [Entomophthora muscae]